MNVFVKGADEVLAKMVSLLEDEGVIAKKASAEPDAELSAIAGSLLYIADQLDMVGASEAAQHIDQALGKLAELGCQPELKDPSAQDLPSHLVARAAATSLIQIGDRLDAMDSQATEHVDAAINSLATGCSCSCDGCKKGQHCGDAEHMCFAKKQ